MDSAHLVQKLKKLWFEMRVMTWRALSTGLPGSRTRWLRRGRVPALALTPVFLQHNAPPGFIVPRAPCSSSSASASLSSSSPPTRVPAPVRPSSAVVAAKSATPQPTLPGTIFTVAAEVEALGAKALPVVVDLRDEAACVACVQATVATFGGVDILINNASALWWQTISDTPTKKYDLIQGINARGAFIMTRECLPHMRTRGWGRVVCMGPPLPTSYKAYAGKTAYYMVSATREAEAHADTPLVCLTTCRCGPHDVRWSHRC